MSERWILQQVWWSFLVGTLVFDNNSSVRGPTGSDGLSGSVGRPVSVAQHRVYQSSWIAIARSRMSMTAVSAIR